MKIPVARDIARYNGKKYSIIGLTGVGPRNNDQIEIYNDLHKSTKLKAADLYNTLSKDGYTMIKIEFLNDYKQYIICEEVKLNEGVNVCFKDGSYKITFTEWVAFGDETYRLEGQIDFKSMENEDV